jgi:hypothetical protein
MPHDASVPPEPGRGRLAPHVRACAHDLPHGSLGFGVHGPRGPHPQSSYMGQPAGIGRVIGRLQPPVLVQRGGVGQRPPGAGRPQSSAEPVPVGGGLHHDALAVCLVPGSWLQHGGPRMREASLRDPLGLLMESHDHTVVCLQLHPAVEWHRWLLRGLAGCPWALQPYCSARLRSLLDDYHTAFSTGRGHHLQALERQRLAGLQAAAGRLLRGEAVQTRRAPVAISWHVRRLPTLGKTV